MKLPKETFIKQEETANSSNSFRLFKLLNFFQLVKFSDFLLQFEVLCMRKKSIVENSNFLIPEKSLIPISYLAKVSNLTQVEVDRSFSILQSYFIHYASEHMDGVLEMIVNLAGMPTFSQFWK